MALTEVHLHCAREEQMRWWHHLWTAAKDLREEGVDIRAVTSWAMLGSIGWNNLLRQPGGTYESGAFCVAGGEPRATALVPMLQACAAGEAFHHPVLEERGWWERPTRILYNRSKRFRSSVMNTAPSLFSQPLLILGKTGTLGRAFAQVCSSRGLHHVLLSRAEMDLSSPQQIANVLRTLKPWAVVNAAGYVRVDDAESDEQTCHAANADGAAYLARACAARDIPLLTFSSDLVFDGNKEMPYVESDTPAPLNVYGQSKAAAEKAVLELHPSALVVRTSAFFGPWDEYNFCTHVLRTLDAGLPVEALTDAVVSPTYVPHLVDACLTLLLDGARGIHHLCNQGETSWYDWARTIAQHAGYGEDFIVPRTRAEMSLPASRPCYCAMTTERGVVLPRFEDAMEEYFHATCPAEKLV
jgi:dTDP-4-dehydrorhamnose reductase